MTVTSRAGPAGKPCLVGHRYVGREAYTLCDHAVSDSALVGRLELHIVDAGISLPMTKKPK
jgi:hypothetical protein